MHTKEEEHPLWNEFILWANEEGVNLALREDWERWWVCFMAGAEAQIRSEE